MNKVGLIAAGGPAPGINGVISSVTIEANNREKEVIGIVDGFKWISKGDLSKVVNLDVGNTSRIHTTGGSIIGISRHSPLATEQAFKNTASSIEKLGIGYLVSIGGDGTMFLAHVLDKHFGGKVRIAHLPKTIDNNIALPDYISTFGFETARDVGAKVMNHIMEEARTTCRWFLIITMGRRTGHLALGIGQSSGSTLTIIPEDFTEQKVSLDNLLGILEGAIIKRLSMGKAYGVAILAEGMIDKIDPVDLGIMDRDNMGRIKYADINFGQLLKNSLGEKLLSKGVDVDLVHKRLGYELRCAQPIPFDVDYTRKLGYCATKYLLGKEYSGGALVYVRRGKMQATPFSDLIDKETNAIKVRYMDTNTEAYEVAQKHMVKMKPNDLKDPETLEKISSFTNLSPKEFNQYFMKLFQ